MSKDHFREHAADWDKVSQRVRNVENIAGEMHRHIRFDRSMELMDFGSGTGLLLERVAPLVGKICAVDTSPAMNEQLALKQDQLECELEILEIDLVTTDPGKTFDGIISSMTIHHVEDTLGLFRKFHALLNEGGFMAIADLDTEDGSFHTEDTGVFHFGFDRDALVSMARDAGFRDAQVSTASTVEKPNGDFPVFLLTAFR